MVMFHSYVSLPEGTIIIHLGSSWLFKRGNPSVNQPAKDISAAMSHRLWDLSTAGDIQKETLCFVITPLDPFQISNFPW